MRIIDLRLCNTYEKIDEQLRKWLAFTFREVSQFLSQLYTMHPVLKGIAMMRSESVNFSKY